MEIKQEDNTDSIQSKIVHKVKPIEQDERWACGPAALSTVLRYQFGLKLTERQLILLTGATPGGADEYNLMRGLDVLGFKYKQSEHGTLDKLKSYLWDGQLPIVHLVVDDGEGHYVVAVGYDEENIYVADPSAGKIKKYGIPFFLGVWKIEEKETQTRWLLTITGHAEDHITPLISKLKQIQKKVQKSRK